MTKAKFDKFFEVIFLILMMTIVIGIPLIFTSYTRSVFEVNKLLLLRLTSLQVLIVWLFKYLFYKANGYDNSPQESISFLGFRWKKVGLEWIVIAWVVANIISTIFSTNIRLSIIGAYDRWEGIITVINYIFLVYMMGKLTTKPYQLIWLFAGIIASTALSGIYGVFQSYGLDFMNWSVDPTKRVFACINNPVHYCAYVGMVVPLGIGWLLHISKKESLMQWIPLKLDLLKWFVFISTVLIYYNQFLSYSRATWMGFIAAMTLFYLMVTYAFNERNKFTYLTDFFITAITLGVFYLSAIFNLHELGIKIWGLIAIVVISYLTILAMQAVKLEMKAEEYFKKIYLVGLGFFCSSILLILGTLLPDFGIVFPAYKAALLFTILYQGILLVSYLKKDLIDWRKYLLTLLTGTMLFFILFIADFNKISTFLGVVSHERLLLATVNIILGVVFIFMSQKFGSREKYYFSRLAIVMIFAKLQFVSISWASMYQYFLLLGIYYLCAFRQNKRLFPEKKYWLFIFLIVFSAVIILPTLPGHVTKLIKGNSTKELKVMKNVYDKVQSYNVVAIKGTARTSMWKSAVPWIKDYWLIGSGLDTVKFMYPKYRRPEYGKLEGGHNFTPDRLHNEYLNTFATKGVIGFVVYYFGIILGWYVLCLFAAYRLRDNSYLYLLSSLMAGAMIYLGQVLFNFGVVATLVLLYIFMGLAIALINMPQKELKDLELELEVADE